ncbi:hypothetical protein FIU97_07530 [Roseivivax sp. THAF40]|uniref:hypothetical protein n=1 Tax=unclassified Roseivivax TaxID=2639302 RepID=UPI001268B2EB|nr:MULTISPECIES: hypothetical protein [unclassified Roseivivax]QFS82646.1 hypothetical protein FIV09_07425 [Roseivivax sp. THAF197b]QFT46415.1 hypothetical protein FIU97_07530 [Roseivivax sp. THAF40]
MVQLIAETDENGGLLWVWIQKDRHERARPIKDAEAHRALLEQASFFGASERDFRNWFERYAR